MQENILFLSHIKLHTENYAIALGIKVCAKCLNWSVFKYFGPFCILQFIILFSILQKAVWLQHSTSVYAVTELDEELIKFMQNLKPYNVRN